ncbi:MAG: MG2 domain-containing protein, partial [Planctomycetota bacterium]
MKRGVVVLLLLSGYLVGQERLPEDERGLYDYAARQEMWPEKERALLRYLEAFPEGARIEQVHYWLATLHHHESGRLEIARDWYAKLCEKFPKGSYHAQARLAIAETYQSQNRKDRALEEFRAIFRDAETEWLRTRAMHEIFQLQDKQFHLNVDQTFCEGDVAWISVYYRNVGGVKLRLFRLPVDGLVEFLGEGLDAAVHKLDRAQWEAVKEWSETLRGPAGEYHGARIPLPEVGSGFYVVEADVEGFTISARVFVNRYALVAKAAAGNLVVFAQERATGAPAPGVRVRLIGGTKTVEGETDAQGLFRASGVAEGGLLLGRKEDELVFTPLHVPSPSQRRSLFYVTTERPVYRPNHTVSYKIVHRVEEGARLTAQEGLGVRVTILDAKGNRVHETDLVLDRFGAADGTFGLADEPALGLYAIHVAPLGETAPPAWDWRMPSQGSFRVEEYRKPEYEVSVEFAKTHVIQGDGVHGAVRATYYFGSPVPGAEVSYKVFRAPRWAAWRREPVWCGWFDEGERRRHAGEFVAEGRGVTSSGGGLEFSFPTEKWEQDADYTVVAEVTDLSRRVVEGSRSIPAPRADFSLEVGTDRYVYRPGETVRIDVRAAALHGAPERDREVSVRVFRGEEEELARLTGRTDAAGAVRLDTKAPEPGYLRLVAEASDDRGNGTTALAWLWVAESGWSGRFGGDDGLTVVADKTSYAKGEKATFLILSRDEDLH